MRLFFMKTTTQTASSAARPNDTSLMSATVTNPPNRLRIAKPESAVLTSGP
jgi:hypothetical protein